MSDSPFLRQSLAYRIHRLQRLLRRHFLRVANEAGHPLTPEQFFILQKLSERDGQTQSELADEDLQDRPNLTRMLRELEERGWIARRPDPDDARRKRVHLTRAGLALHGAFVDSVVGPAREQLFGALDPALVEQTHAVFDHLEAAL